MQPSVKYGILWIILPTRVNYTKEKIAEWVAKKLYRILRRYTIPMIKFIESVLLCFRSCFSRGATFKWFVTIVVGMMVRQDNYGVTSVIRALSLKPSYEPLIRFFRSSSFKIRDLMCKWAEIVANNALGIVRVGDAAVLTGDGIKIPKEGRRMPGVKRLHQESENTTKAEYIFGQLFGCVGVLTEWGKKTFCIPLACELQDGVKEIMSWTENIRRASQTVEMISLAHRLTRIFPKAILLLDRYYLTTPALERLDALNVGGGDLRAIIMAKSNATAYNLPEVHKPGVRGRPKVKGASVRLADLFSTEASNFVSAAVVLYGEKENIQYLAKDLLWGKGLHRLMRFVLVEYGGRRAIIASTDTTIDPLDIVILYAKRFSIECTFKAMKHDVAAFAYHFWTKYMPKLNRFEKTGAPDRVTKVKSDRAKEYIRKALDATEAYVFCGVVATGLLQMLSFRDAKYNEMKKTRYQRTPSRTVASEAIVSDYLVKSVFWHMGKEPGLTISKIIREKMDMKMDDFRLVKAS